VSSEPFDNPKRRIAKDHLNAGRQFGLGQKIAIGEVGRVAVVGNVRSEHFMSGCA
jgi:hypothetical protein